MAVSLRLDDVAAAVERSGEAEGLLLRAAFDALDVGVLVLAADRTIVLSNAAFERSAGLTPRPEPQPDGPVARAELSSELLAENGVSVLRPDGSPWPADDWPVHHTLASGQAQRDVLLRMRRRDRDYWVSVSCQPLPTGSGEGATVAVFTDVTRRRHDDLALQESEAHFRLLAENCTDIITRHRADGVCLYASPAVRELLGREPDALQGLAATRYIHPDDREACLATLRDLRHSGEVSSQRYRLSRADGSWVWVETVMRPVRADGLVLELQSSTRDISARVDAEQRLARLALADSLTGLANRAALLQALEDLQGQALALLFLDLDRFKAVNDSLGHSAGDELLRTVARRLTDACRDEDVVARLGGDEFVVVAAGLPHDRALALASRVQAVLASPVQLGGRDVAAGGSLGLVVTGDGDERDAEQLLRDADTAMYTAKAAGRSLVHLWDADSDALPEARG